MRDPVQWAYDLQHFGIKLGLDNIRALLDLLEHPQRAFRTAHVAGTNGKGSVAAMLAALLDAHGLRSGLFTSPHLVTPTERIRIAGDDIPLEGLHRQLNGIRERVEAAVAAGRLDNHPSFFEVMTASALNAFKEAEVRAAVLEVGLGGRLDATNAVETDVPVIVSIGLDHMKTLGPSLEQIATEKAGIVKPDRPLLSGVTQPEARAVIRDACRERGATLIELDACSSVEAHDDGSLTVQTEQRRYPDLRLSLAGRHQHRNAQTAVAALELLLERFDREPDPQAVRDALASVRWPGRLQWIDGTPPLLVDGAHNADGAAALADYLARKEIRPSALLFGGMRGKQFDLMLAALAPHVPRIVITRPGVNRSEEPETIAAIARERWPASAVEVVEPPLEALDAARERAREGGGALLVAGSLYLVGQVLGSLRDEPVPGPISM